MSKILVARATIEQALEALEDVDGPITALLGNLLGSPDESAPGTKVRASITALRAALATPVPHGCHVDLEDGVEPDGCVLDEGEPEKCIYAKRLHREGKDKTACEYWKPIEVKK